jgi:DNA-binding protein HU-beta
LVKSKLDYLIKLLIFTFYYLNNGENKPLKQKLMNKGDLINKIAASAKITKSQATDALNAVVEGIGDELKAGGKVTLIGFGTFSVSHREARNGRNPRTGQTLKIKSKNSVKFKAGKELSDSVN